MHQAIAARNHPAKHVLIMALGGGGDVISAFMLGNTLMLRGLEPVIASLAWERFVKDPTPGPRSPTELQEIELITSALGRVTHNTAFPRGALTNQAKLCEQFGDMGSYILDASGGVATLVEGLRRLDSMYRFADAWGVDVGGDILAEEPLSSLSSPLADALMLAALNVVHSDAKVAVMGLGIDGEIPRHIWEPSIACHLCSGLVEEVITLPMQIIYQIASLFDRRALDSEVTAILVRAYLGLQGTVLIRDAASVIHLGIEALPVFVYRAKDICEKINKLPTAIERAISIEHSSLIIEAMGYASEWRYEHEKFKRLSSPYAKVQPAILFQTILDFLQQLKSLPEPVHFVSERHIAEKLKVDLDCVKTTIDSLWEGGLIKVALPFIGLPSSPSQ